MKTFEERYTAWIDGQLQGGALSAFEQELTRRAAGGEAAADKTDAIHLRALLQDHLQAPALTNADFFSHQLRERIDAERAASPRGREANRRAEPAIFAWGFARLVGLGALSLFAAAALYYGMMPSHPGSPADSASIASRTNSGSGGVVAGNDTPAPVPQPVVPDSRNSDGPILMVQNSTPATVDLSPDIKTFVPDQPSNPTTITPLHYTKPNVNVLWLNGLEYLPSVPDTTTDPDVVRPTASPAPAASASASP